MSLVWHSQKTKLFLDENVRKHILMHLIFSILNEEFNAKKQTQGRSCLGAKVIEQMVKVGFCQKTFSGKFTKNVIKL